MKAIHRKQRSLTDKRSRIDDSLKEVSQLLKKGTGIFTWVSKVFCNYIDSVLLAHVISPYCFNIALSVKELTAVLCQPLLAARRSKKALVPFLNATFQKGHHNFFGRIKKFYNLSGKCGCLDVPL